MSFIDEDRTCTSCGARYAFRAGEQRFFSERGIPDPPQRCPSCRRQRKATARRGMPAHARLGRDPSLLPEAATLPSAAQLQGDHPQSALPSCAWCGGPARVPFEVALHRPVACEACYRWRLGVGSALHQG